MKKGQCVATSSMLVEHQEGGDDGLFINVSLFDFHG